MSIESVEDDETSLTDEERQEDVISNCRPATVTLRTYMDAGEPNVAEIEVELKNRLKVMKTMVIVQKDAPQELQLGTDTLRSLAFSMELKELPESCEQGEGQEAVIRLIKVLSNGTLIKQPITVHLELYLFYHFIHVLLFIGQY